MKFLKTVLIFSTAISFLISSGLFAQSKVGTSAANFLQIGAGARGAALGDAASTTFYDASSIYWNPALAAFSDNNQVFFNHTNWFAGISLNYGSGMLNFGSLGTFALAFYSLSTDQMEVTDETYQDGTGALFTVQDIMVGLTYARALTDRFNIGATVKYINETIWNTSATALAVDVGFTFHTPLEALNLAMSISNFGTEMRMDGTDLAVRYDPDPTVGGNNDGIVAYQKTKSWSLPVILRFGLALNMIKTENMDVNLLSDVLYPSSNNNYVNSGLEIGFRKQYYLRAGYRQLFLKDAEGNLSVGAGVKIGSLNLDYAFSDRGVLNSVQYFSVAFNL